MWNREETVGDASYSFTNLYQTGAPQEAVKVTADAAFGALATWLSEQQRLVERAFEARPIAPRAFYAEMGRLSNFLAPPPLPLPDGALHADAALHGGARPGAD